MLLPYTTLTYFGPGAGASVGGGSTAAVSGGIQGRGRIGGLSEGAGSVPLARPTRLVNGPATIQAAGQVSQALPKARARPGIIIRVNALSQDDVTGAVLESLIEPGLSVKQALRLLSAALAGKVAGAGGPTVTIRNTADTKNRIVATVDASGNRTAITTDLTDG